MSDKADEILKGLGRLSPVEIREVIENLTRQSGNEHAQLAHLPGRLSCEDIIERAKQAETFHWHIVDGLFDTMVDSRDASTEQDAVKFAYDPEQMQPWYSRQKEPVIPTSPARKVSYEEFRKWIRRE